MKCVTCILFLLGSSHIAWSLYPPSNYGQQQQQQLLLQQNLLQQEIRRLQQQLYTIQQQLSQGQVNKAASDHHLGLPNAIIDDFEYIPTEQGYRFSYRLPDATRLEENAVISGLGTTVYSRPPSKTTDFTAAGVDSRPKTNLKNRKLSPGSLRALAG